jgi:hypothetical protein
MKVDAAVDSSAIDEANDACGDDMGGLGAAIVEGRRRRNERICGRIAATSSAVTSCPKVSTDCATIADEFDRSGHSNPDE